MIGPCKQEDCPIRCMDCANRTALKITSGTTTITCKYGVKSYSIPISELTSGNKEEEQNG